jgi:tripartite-type tricarboxylate transporter receptor subunit TctC
MRTRYSGAAVLLAGLTAIAAAQDFPIKPIRIIASPPGGANNFVARLVGEGLNEVAGWPFVVDNRPSGGFLQGELLMRSPPDGYTLLAAASAIILGPLMEKAPYDVIRDFAPVCLVTSAPSVLIVHSSLPVKSVKELVALAKARPGELNFSTSGTGSSNHLPAELFKYLAGVNIVRVNYKGAGPALIGLMSGEAQIMFATATSATPHMASGRVRGLAVTSAKRSALVNLPTIAESGVPGYDFAGTIGLLAPARTPPAIINRLNQEIVRALRQPHMAKRVMDSGAELVGSTPAEYAATIAAEISTWGKVIRQSGLAGP